MVSQILSNVALFGCMASSKDAKKFTYTDTGICRLF